MSYANTYFTKKHEACVSSAVRLDAGDERRHGWQAPYRWPDPDWQPWWLDDLLLAHVARPKALTEKLQAEATDLCYRNFQLRRGNSELDALQGGLAQR